MVVYHNPTCDCCGRWVEYLRKGGFNVTVVVRKDMAAVKDSLGVPRQLWSCHTAIIDGHIVEGHATIGEIDSMLADGEQVRGIAVPGMPVGSPGMQTGPPQPYDVVAFRADGAKRIFATH